MNNNKAVAVLILAATLAVGACDAATGSAGGSPIGIGGVSARAKGAGFTAVPQIAFYRVSGASFIQAQGVRDTCFITTYSTTGTGGSTNVTPIGAGAYITVALGNRLDSLTRSSELDASYRSTLSSGIPFTPGDSMVITVPGDRAGFPTSTFRGKTAEPFSVDPVAVPPTGSPINISWTPASDLNAAMFINFHYIASGTTETSFNRQLACSFVDDGTGQVPAAVATEWIAATSRDYTAQRIRTILVQIDLPLSYFNVVSMFDWPTPIAP